MEKLLGTYLKQKRIEADLTQIQVARQLGQSTIQYLSSIERGACEPSIKVLKQLGEIYQIPPQELFEKITDHRKILLSKVLFSKRIVRRTSIPE